MQANSMKMFTFDGIRLPICAGRLAQACGRNIQADAAALKNETMSMVDFSAAMPANANATNDERDEHDLIVRAYVQALTVHNESGF